MAGGRLQVGWRGLSRAIALTVAITSAFWIALGAWLLRGHAGPETGQQTSPQSGAQTVSQGARRQGLLGTWADTAPSAGGNAGISLPAGALAIPVAQVAPGQLVDTFTRARADGARRHDAIDILAPEGTPVLAAQDGAVEKLFASQEGGLTIYLRTPDRRWLHYYAHLSAYAPGLREGMSVRQGQTIGAVGHSGNADAQTPHLHFAIWRADPRQGWSQAGQAINPYPLLTAGASRTARSRPAQSNTSD